MWLAEKAQLRWNVLRVNLKNAKQSEKFYQIKVTT